MKNLRELFSATLAGFMVGIGGTAFIACEQKYLGAFLFSVGLFTICAYGMNLFTGKIGYIMDNKPKYLLFLVLVWVGNFIGAYLVALFLRFYRPELVEKTMTMCQSKLAQAPLQTIILAMFCGLLMFIAVDSYKKLEGTARYIGVFICVPAFIVCGFEHVVADMYYFSMMSPTSFVDGPTLRFLLWATIGNVAGAQIIPCLRKWRWTEKQ